MECVEARAALKSSSFLSEVVGMKPLPSSSNTYLVENIWCATVGGGGTFTGGDDFAIEEYFDISAGEEFDEEEEDEEVEKRSSSSSSSSSCSMSLSPIHGVAHAPELEIPEDMKELETWANLMDDSIPDDLVMTTYPPVAAPISFKPEPIFRNRVPIVLDQPNQQLFVVNSSTKTTGFPVKPRTSRTRKPGSAWLQSHHLKPEPLFSSSSSTSSWGTEYEFSPSLSEESGLIFIPNPTIHGSGSVALSILGDLKKPAKKKQKINRQSPEAGGSQHGAGQLRRCTHCQVQKTPQWRTGPLGPKTLCNACGVRFKSGRLFPEYRPACSPTFSSEVHSNSHRKVLEMRKKKENGEPEEVPMTMTIMSC